MSTFDDTDLKRIGRQVNFYLSDKNLAKDDFFKKFIADDGAVKVPLDAIAKCPAVSTRTTDKAAIKTAVVKTPFLVVTEDNHVARATPFDKARTIEPETDTAVLYLTNLPKTAVWKQVKAAIDKHVNVAHTKMQVPLAQKRARPTEESKTEPEPAGAEETKADDGEDAAEPSAKQRRTATSTDKATAAAGEETGKEETKAGGEAAAGAGAGAVATPTAHMIVNCPGEKPEDILAELVGAGIKIANKTVTIELLTGEELTQFWRKRKTFLSKRSTGDKPKTGPKKKEDKLVTLAGKEFRGFAGLASFCTDVIRGGEAGKPFQGEIAAVLKHLLCYHPNAKDKTEKLAALTVGSSASFPDTVCLKSVKADGTVVDWSWRKSVHHLLDTSTKAPVVDPETVPLNLTATTVPTPADSSDKK